MSAKPPIVYVAPWSWEALYNRSQPLALALARAGHRVLYVQPREEAYPAEDASRSRRWLRSPRSRVTLSPGPHPLLSLVEVRSEKRRAAVPLSSDFSPPARAALETRLKREFRGQKATLISSRPQLYSFFDYPLWSRIALDMEDPWLELSWGQNPYAVIRIRQAIDRADACFANGVAIADFFRERLGAKVHSLPNGVESATLETLLAPLPRPAALDKGANRFRVCFLGKINDRIHFSLLAQVLPQAKDTDFYFVGQAVILEKDKAAWQSLLAAPNCFHVGLVPFEQVPAFLTHSDALLLPYTEAGGAKMFPAKLLEYVAARKPIIATHVPAELALLSEAFHTYDSPQSLGNLLEALASAGMALDPQLARECLAFAQAATWDHRASELVAELYA